jgi:hypothetical protein
MFGYGKKRIIGQIKLQRFSQALQGWQEEGHQILQSGHESFPQSDGRENNWGNSSRRKKKWNQSTNILRHHQYPDIRPCGEAMESFRYLFDRSF